MEKGRLLAWCLAGVAVLFALFQASFTIYILMISTTGIEDIKFRQEPNEDYAKHIRIPAVVHQIWRDANISNYPMTPSRYSWMEHYPHYEVKLWTEEDILKLIQEEYSWLYPTYKSYTYNIQRADVARYVVLHWEGGIYADLDAYAKNSSIEVWRDAQLVLPETADHTTFSNHFIMSEPKSPFLEFALQQLESHNQYLVIPYVRVFWSTGPLFMGDIVRKWMALNPHFDLAVLRKKPQRKFVQHRGGRSWHGYDGKFLNWVSENAWFLQFLYGLAAVVLGCLCYRMVYKRCCGFPVCDTIRNLKIV